VLAVSLPLLFSIRAGAWGTKAHLFGANFLPSAAHQQGSVLYIYLCIIRPQLWPLFLSWRVNYFGSVSYAEIEMGSRCNANLLLLADNLMLRIGIMITFACG